MATGGHEWWPQFPASEHQGSCHLQTQTGGFPKKPGSLEALGLLWDLLKPLLISHTLQGWMAEKGPELYVPVALGCVSLCSWAMCPGALSYVFPWP